MEQWRKEHIEEKINRKTLSALYKIGDSLFGYSKPYVIEIEDLEERLSSYKNAHETCITNSKKLEKQLSELYLEYEMLVKENAGKEQIQLNENTEIAGWCKWKSPTGEVGVPNVAIEINGKSILSNKNGVFTFNIPNAWLNSNRNTFKATFYADGYKIKDVVYSVQKNETTSRIIWLFKGIN